MSALIEPFGTTPAGEIVEKITISSEALTVSVLTWGAVLQDVRLAGVAHPLTLGSPDLAAYAGRMNSFGSVIGPVVNRIRGASAPIAGVLHQFEANMGGGAHTKHGGSYGPHSSVWRIVETSPSHAVLELEVADGLSGFPGNRVIRAEYRVIDAALDLVLIARTDKTTLINLANHSYWNLDGSLDASSHTVQIFADRYTENDETLMVTGRVLPVEGTQFDFRAPRAFGSGPHTLYDLNLVLADAKRPLTLAAVVTGVSGVSLEMSTTEPGLQIFDFGSFDSAEHNGHHGAPYPSYSGIALEAQGWPDAANHEGWPSIEVTADVPYHQHTRWAFSK